MRAESFLPKKAFAGSGKNKLGTKGQARGEPGRAQKAPLTGLMVGEEQVSDDWQKVNKGDKTDGMSKKAVKAYRRENPGSKLKTAVTTKPSKLKKGSKDAKRRKSFCARMSGMKKSRASAKTKRDPDSPINKALRRWNCESIEEMRDMIAYAEQQLSVLKEGWSQKYKKSINCSHPKGFSQKAHCAGKKKHSESVEMEMTCPECGMCETHGNLNEIKKGQKDSNGYTKCWSGKHAEGTKKSSVTGKQVRNCVPNEGVKEASNPAQQAAIAISKKEKQTAEDQRLDPKCWKGYKKSGTKMKDGTRVNNCVKVGEGWEQEISRLIKLLESK